MYTSHAKGAPPPGGWSASPKFVVPLSSNSSFDRELRVHGRIARPKEVPYDGRYLERSRS